MCAAVPIRLLDSDGVTATHNIEKIIVNSQEAKKPPASDKRIRI